MPIRSVLRGVALSALLLTGCAGPSAPAPDRSAEAVSAVRARAARWQRAAAERDVEAFLDLYADDVLVLVEAAPDVRGAEAMRATIVAMMQDPAFELTFAPGEVVAARSGELAYETGTYVLTMSGPAGEPLTSRGAYLVVWREQADGSWKAAVDAPVSDAPWGAAGG
jgi:uncharacterized protein (TIGR02246 family)